ncbi:MAG: folate-binding protein [Actinomycetota bacterium]|nr:folate-binding protein [Actinomycetota bacterium]
MDLPLAVAGPAGSVDGSIAWHFGDPHREQRFLADGLSVVDISNRGVVTVTGPDRLTWLHTLTTQHLENLQPNESALVLILSPHGHVEHELHLVDDGETTWLIVEPGTADALEKYLLSMQFMLRVTISNVTSRFAVVWESISTIDADYPTWLVPEPFASRGFRGREVILPRGELTARLTSAPELSGSWALEALRVAASMPRLGFETDHKTLPHEVGWIGSAVHLQKGCYRGQETVARVQNLGKPPRRLVLLHLDGSPEILPGHAARVFAGDDEVGWVGSAARHYELGPVATAIVKRKVPVDAVLTVRTDEGDVAAAQENTLTI